MSFELNITRTFDAPRELVWKAWTDPEMAKEWMGPRGFTTTEFTTGTEAGAAWHLTMAGERPGSDEPVTLGQGGRMIEIRPPELLKYTFGWDNRASVGLGDGPKENVVTVRFEEQGGKTVMHFTQGPFATASERDGHTGGWNSAFDCFAEFMLAEQPERRPADGDVPTELHMKRLFKAPRKLVFDAWTNAESLRDWWGPAGFTVGRCEFEARNGGKLHIDMIGPDGAVYPMGGKVVEIYPPHRLHIISAALDAEGKPMFENWNSVFFEEVDGETMVTLDVHVMSMTEAAPRYLKGMKMGWQMTLDKLETFLRERT